MKLRTLLVIFLIASIPYIWNAATFFNCDFEADYKCEIIHSIGVVVPPLSYITVWFAGDE